MSLRAHSLAFVIAISLFIVGICCLPDASAEVPSGYSYKKSFSMPGSTDGDLYDYQVRFTLHRNAGNDRGTDVYLNNHSENWPGDIRFTDSKDRLLNYWIENSDTNSATVWVNVPFIPEYPEKAIVNLYYGSKSGQSASDGHSTFPFFDDFSSSNLDRWNTGVTPMVNDGSMNLDSAGDFIQSKRTFDPGTTALRARLYSALPEDYFSAFGYGGYQGNGAWNFLDPDGAYLWFEYGGLGDYVRLYAGSKAINSGITPFPDREWHTYDISMDRSYKTVTITSDGSPMLSGTGDMPVSNYRNVFFGRHQKAPGNVDVRADWILVRSNTQNEPSNGDWGKEQQLRNGLCTGVLGLALFPLLLVGIRRLR
jgi:hypothetical protein